MARMNCQGNPLLAEWVNSRGRDDTAVRREAANRYAWAIPNDEALDAVAALAPIVELGAGRGYWAALLAERGADIVCYDLYPPEADDVNGWHDQAGLYYPVKEGGGEMAALHADRTLFLCWPPHSPTRVMTVTEPPDPENWERIDKEIDGVMETIWHKPGQETHLATGALAAYEAAGGRTVVYVGEGPGGCTGGDAFHDRLQREWTEVDEIAIPQWDGIHDKLWVWARS